MIFSGKRNIIFPENTRKIIFQLDFFEKSIFSEHLEKENMVFRAVTCIWAWFFISSDSLQRWCPCSFCVFMLHLWEFLSKKKPPKRRGIIVICFGLERITNFLKLRKMAGYVKHWKVKNFLRSQPSLAHDKWDIFWLTSFKSCICPCQSCQFFTNW